MGRRYIRWELGAQEKNPIHSIQINRNTHSSQPVIAYSHSYISSTPIKVTMKFLSLLFSTLSLVAFSQAAAVVAERDMATQNVGVCPAGTAQAGKNKGFHDE
jgi:hypothetical protein